MKVMKRGVVSVIITTWCMVTGVTAYNVTTVTPDNYTEVTQGKSVFVRFFAPWCDHSSKMAPDWQALANDWVDHPYSLILDVDCTATKKTTSLFCKKQHGVYDYPTLKYGNANALHEYQGPRTYDVLAQFAKEFLTGYQCTTSSSQPNACTPEQRQWLQHYQTLSTVELETAIQEVKSNITLLKKEFQKTVDQLQKDYQEMVETKAQRIKEIENGDLWYMLAIQKARTKGITGPVNEIIIDSGKGNNEEL